MWIGFIARDPVASVDRASLECRYVIVYIYTDT